MSYVVYLENSGEDFFNIDANSSKEEGDQVVFYKDSEVVSRIDKGDIRTYLKSN